MKFYYNIRRGRKVIRGITTNPSIIRYIIDETTHGFSEYEIIVKKCKINNKKVDKK